MAHNPNAIANAFLDFAKQSGVEVSPMKLQKLIYYAHGWHLALTGEPLIDEPVEAWGFGPVIPSVYEEFKHYGARPIRGRAGQPVMLADGSIDYEIWRMNPDEHAERVMRKVWDVYGGLSATQLSKMTHEPNSPWERAWRNRRGLSRHIDIPNDSIAEYFVERARDDRARA